MNCFCDAIQLFNGVGFNGDIKTKLIKSLGSGSELFSNHPGVVKLYFGVNIADFSLARNEKKEALAVILVDNIINDVTLNELLEIEACISVQYARL